MIKQKLQPYNLILASASPRRSELLKGMDIPFSLAPKFEVDEIYPDEICVNDIAAYLSKLKSSHYPHLLNPRDIVITADTTVVVERQVLGKPKNKTQAQAMLVMLSGKKHSVTTGVTLRNMDSYTTFSVSTDVFFNPLTIEQIDYYIDNYSPFDKAGSYGIQEWIGYIAIERIEGSFYNVMGLPVARLNSELLIFTDKL